jgi:autotransporter family porin
MLTLTAVNGTSDGYVSAWPCDQPQPDSSVLNLWPGVLRSNLALIKLSATNGSICVRSTTYDGSPLHLIVDAVGWQTGGPSRQPPPVEPPPPSRFGTLPPGSALPSDATCATRVRPSAEIRSVNAPYNSTRGNGANSTYPRVTGNFTGTTDEILQWAACKWGIDEDIVRAQIAKESWWDHRSVGDGGESFGLGQVRVPYHASAFVNDNAKRSSAYNVDYTYAVWRECYEGRLTWLNTVDRGRDYAGGDAMGCLGVWFSGRWYTPAAVGYINAVQDYLNQRIWTTPNFVNYG